MKHTLYTVWVPIVRFPGHVYHTVCNADFSAHLRYLLPLFCLGFTFFCRECWVGWCFSPSVPWGCKGFSSFYLCVSFLGAVAQEGSMLNASLLIHLPCTSLQPEVGTAWPLRSKGLGNGVAVAGLNPSRSSLGSQVLPHPFTIYGPVVALPCLVWEPREVGEVLLVGCLYRFFLMARLCLTPVYPGPTWSPILGLPACLDGVPSFL